MIESRTVRIVTRDDVSTTIKRSGPGPMSEPVFRKRFGEEEVWGREYSRNRYLRFETRVDVNQRYQDLMKNITILTDTDKVDVTGEKHCNRPLEYGGSYLSKKSGAVHQKRRWSCPSFLELSTIHAASPRPQHEGKNMQGGTKKAA